jgi:hypothetical protein
MGLRHASLADQLHRLDRELAANILRFITDLELP